MTTWPLSQTVMSGLLYPACFIKLLLLGIVTYSIPTLAQTFTNPPIWEDLADLMVVNVNNTFYYSASTMHYSPGAPILRSYDLVNWEYIGHSVPSLDFGDSAYSLQGGRAYVRGIWASYLNFRQSTNTWYWGGCVDFTNTFIYTAPSVTGPWTKRSELNTCYYDSSLLIDDDDKMYVSFGSTNISVAQLSTDGLSETSRKVVYTTELYIEGSRFYKHNGRYYIFVTHPASEEYVLMSTNGPFGPYTSKALVQSVAPPVSSAGNPHQGGLVCTQNDSCYYYAFIDSYPGGRVPVAAPLTWGSDGFPSVNLVNGAWGKTYPYPLPQRVVGGSFYTDNFTAPTLGPKWEWNHNPDSTKWSISGGLTLNTATVTNDLYSARNTLTHRIPGPSSTATIAMDISGMANGDRAGFAIFRDWSAWIGVARDNSQNTVQFVNNVTMNTNWTTTSTGSVAQSTSLSGSTIYLRIAANIAPASDHNAKISYSTDGSNFISFGSPFNMNADWHYFMGSRFGIFNYATSQLGGSVKIRSFSVQSS